VQSSASSVERIKVCADSLFLDWLQTPLQDVLFSAYLYISLSYRLLSVVIRIYYYYVFMMALKRLKGESSTSTGDVVLITSYMLSLRSSIELFVERP
jgi:hypothetical protein